MNLSSQNYKKILLFTIFSKKLFHSPNPFLRHQNQLISSYFHVPSTLNLLTTLEWADNAVISLHLTPSLPRRLSRAAHQCCKVYANLLLSISIIVLLSSLFIFTFTTKKQQQNVDLEKVLWFPERYLSLDPVGDVFMVISDHFLTGSPNNYRNSAISSSSYWI